MASKNKDDGATWLRKKFYDIFNRLDTVRECDRRTDRRTPADSQYRVYA